MTIRPFTRFPAASSNSGTVLIVGDSHRDNDPIRPALEDIEDQSFVIVESATATDALCRLGSGEFDVAFIAEDASAANNHKTQILALMSHEFRTPLNAILGFSEAIGYEIFGGLGGDGSSRYKEYVKHIHSSGTHLLSLINDLLDLSKSRPASRIFIRVRWSSATCCAMSWG